MRTAGLMFGVLLLLVVQAVEVWKWYRDPRAITPGQFRRRLITAGILQLVLLMWFVGERLVGHQPPLTQLAYWTAALLFGIASAFSAIREMGEVSRQYYRQRAELFRRATADATGRQGDGETGRANDSTAD